MKIYTYILLLGCFSLHYGLSANVNLDDFAIRKNVAYVYSPQSNKLTITLKNIRIACKTGTEPLGRLIGSYPNPNFKPFTEGFVLGGQSPHCLVYQIAS